jgi:hypothetical protein
LVGGSEKNGKQNWYPRNLLAASLLHCHYTNLLGYQLLLWSRPLLGSLHRVHINETVISGVPQRLWSTVLYIRGVVEGLSVEIVPIDEKHQILAFKLQ